MRVVISQSMYFPWVGMLEQIRLADVYVRYDDVQFSKGSFTNRVQVKTSSGMRWLTVPLRDLHLGQKINEVAIDNRTDWRARHRDVLELAYQSAPFREDMLAIVDRVFAGATDTVGEVSYASMFALADYFGIDSRLVRRDSANLGIGGESSDRVFDIVHALGATTYITGHGARNYLDHEKFERGGVDVVYMNYERVQYPQLHGEFTPFVSALDLVANCGKEGLAYIRSSAVTWRTFLSPDFPGGLAVRPESLE